MTNLAKPIIAFLGPAEAEDVVREVVGDRFEVRSLAPDAEDLSRSLLGATVFLDASMQVHLTGQMIEQAPELRLVVAATTGADHIDQEALRRRSIPLLTLKGQNQVLRDLTSAAEHSWLLLMACARKLCAARAHVVAGGWDRSAFAGIMLRGKTLGIVGCGRIGGWMGRYAEAFGMVSIGYDPFLSEWPRNIRPVTLENLLAASDFITLHVHLTADTHRMIDRERIAQMKPGCIFINTSRGDLVDEHALLKALASGRIAAVGLDVLQGEPDIEKSPLRKYAIDHDNVIITPHIGGFSPDAVRTVVRFSAERIVRYFEALGQDRVNETTG